MNEEGTKGRRDEGTEWNPQSLIRNPQSAIVNEARDNMHVGYMLRMYPRFTQTFVVNEILELERQGVGLSILSLKKPTDGRFHESLSRVRARAEYIPELFAESRARILKTHWSNLRARPRSYARTVAETFRHRGADGTDLLQAALVLRWARKRDVRHVHVHFGTHEASVAYLANIMGGLSYSLTLHAFDIFRENVDRRLLACKINSSRFTVTVSEYNRDFMINNLPGVEPDKIRVNYNGIDLKTFRTNGAPRTPFAILSVGRLIEKKGFIHLIRAVARLRDTGLEVSCTIVGEGPEKGRLKAEIKMLGLNRGKDEGTKGPRDQGTHGRRESPIVNRQSSIHNPQSTIPKAMVTLAGPLSQSRVRRLLAEAACFALPCVQAKDGNVDALPTVLLEAMACGCPCVSTTISGVPEIIEHGHSGLLVGPGNEEGLADAIGLVLQDSDLAASLAGEGRRRVESLFDIRRNVAGMKNWFTQVLKPTDSNSWDLWGERSLIPTHAGTVLSGAEGTAAIDPNQRGKTSRWRSGLGKAECEP
ncbi:MAG: glycosyltransferase family 4 protein [Phycisphaerae bacterium]